MKNKLLAVRLGQHFSPPIQGLHSHRLTQMERGGNSATLTEVSYVLMKLCLKYRAQAG